MDFLNIMNIYLTSEEKEKLLEETEEFYEDFNNALKNISYNFETIPEDNFPFINMNNFLSLEKDINSNVDNSLINQSLNFKNGYFELKKKKSA